MSTSPLLDAALYYASRGWYVIPLHTATSHGCSCSKRNCEAPAKHPRTPHGLKDATLDKDQIREWWRRWPDANVGIVTGGPSCLVVLDIDPRHGGDESLMALIAEHGRLPDTIEALTGGGGRHILFAHPGRRIRNGTNKLGPGLDIRGDGGYIVAAPSVHISGGRYTWEMSSRPSQTQLAPLPAWLIELLAEPEVQSVPEAAGAVSEQISYGARNQTLTSLAGTMRRRGMTSREIMASLLVVNRERCNPPLPEEEVKRISCSVGRYVPSAPPVFRDAPEVDFREPLNAWDSGLKFIELLYSLDGRSIKTYIGGLDETLGGLERQTMSVLAARPSMGKSTLAWQIARNVAASKLKAMFYSLEMSAASLWAKAACGATGLRWRDFRAERGTEEQKEKVVAKTNELMELYGDNLLIDDGVNTTETIWRGVEKYRPDLVVVDHLRLLADKNANEVQRLGEVSQRLKDIAKAFNCHVCVLAQLNRGTEIRDNKRPTLADLRDSGQIEENADLVMMMYRPDYYDDSAPASTSSQTEILIRKFRDDIPRQRVILSFDTQHQWFDDVRELRV